MSLHIKKVLAFALVVSFASFSTAPPLQLFADEVAPTIDLTTLFTSRSSIPKVDQASGAFAERIELNIPPGRNGLTPNLALLYSSQDLVDGIVGYGWSLSIPYIERFRKTGSENLYTSDTYSSSIDGELVGASSTNTACAQWVSDHPSGL